MKKTILILCLLVMSHQTILAADYEYEHTLKMTRKILKELQNEQARNALENLDAIELLEKIDEEEHRGNYAAVLGYYNEIIRRMPDDSGAYGARAIIYLDQYQNYTQAINDYTLAIKYDKIPNANSYTLRGFARMKLGDLDGAISDSTKAISINNQNKTPEAWAYCNRAMAYLLKRDYSAAINDTTTSIKLQTKNPEAFLIRGMSKVAMYGRQRSLEGVQSGITDINYSKEQFLQAEDMEGYQKAMGTYKTGQIMMEAVKRELSKK